MNLTTPKAILTGFSLIALAILFQTPIKQLITSPAQAQPLVSDHEILKADHKAIKTGLRTLRSLFVAFLDHRPPKPDSDSLHDALQNVPPQLYPSPQWV